MTAQVRKKCTSTLGYKNMITITGNNATSYVAITAVTTYAAIYPQALFGKTSMIIPLSCCGRFLL